MNDVCMVYDDNKDIMYDELKDIKLKLNDKNMKNRSNKKRLKRIRINSITNDWLNEMNDRRMIVEYNMKLNRRNSDDVEYKKDTTRIDKIDKDSELKDTKLIIFEIKKDDVVQYKWDKHNKDMWYWWMSSNKMINMNE